MTMSRRMKIILPPAILLTGAAILVGLMMTRPQPSRRATEAPRPLVETYTVTADVEPVRVHGYGTVRARQRISLVPQVSGVIVHRNLAFEAGGTFAAGEVLLRLEETDYRLAVERGEADLARAEYNLALAEEEAVVARREWEQLRDGLRDDAVSEPSPLLFREPQLQLARAELAAARAALEQARVNLERCTLTAPFAGLVLATSADEGQYVRAGEPVGEIHAIDAAEITVSVPDRDLAWIELPRGEAGGGGDARLGSPAVVVADFAGARHDWPGRVVRLGGAVDERSRLVPVVVRVERPFAAAGDRPPLLEGMFVEIFIEGRELPGAVSIPRAALRADERVWIVDDEDRLEIRPVTVARAGVERALVADGLAPGERVCVSNLQIVSDGMAVRTAAGAAGELTGAGTASVGDDDAAGRASLATDTGGAGR